MMVVVAHELVSKPDINPSIDSFALRMGPLGVQIFFAISGYLICTLLLLESDKRPISLRAFYTRRVFRILPPAFTYLTVVGLLSAAGFISVRGIDIASCIFLFANYITNGWYVAHFWSLSVEEHFYLLWPAILAFAGWRRASRIAIAGMVVVGSWRLYSGPTLYFGEETAWLRTDMVLDAFFAPCLLAILLHHYPAFKTKVQRLSSPLTTIALAALLVIATVAGVNPAVKKSLQAVLLPLIVVSTVLQPATWMGRILEASCDALGWPDLLLAVSMATDVCGPVPFVEHAAVSSCGVVGNRRSQLLLHRASNDGVRAFGVATESF